MRCARCAYAHTLCCAVVWCGVVWCGVGTYQKSLGGNLGPTLAPEGNLGLHLSISAGSLRQQHPHSPAAAGVIGTPHRASEPASQRTSSSVGTSSSEPSFRSHQTIESSPARDTAATLSHSSFVQSSSRFNEILPPHCTSPGSPAGTGSSVSVTPSVQQTGKRRIASLSGRAVVLIPLAVRFLTGSLLTTPRVLVPTRYP